MLFIHRYPSPIGMITMAGTDSALTGLWLEGQKHFASTVSEEAKEEVTFVFSLTCRWLDLYFSGNQPDFLPPVYLQGTAFQKAVWDVLLTIPYGQTVTYGQIAGVLSETLQKPRMSAQAVGNAVGRNPVSILVPCHRVTGSDGSLTGYAGGLYNKMFLLDLEKKGRKQ